MRIVDSHFHWWPRSIFEALCKRQGYPRATVDGKGGYDYWRREKSADYHLAIWPAWFDLDEQLAHMDGLGHHVDVVGSIGPFSVHFSDLPVSEGKDAALAWNEEMAWAQRKYPGRFWGTAAIPLVDTKTAIDVLDHAIGKLGLIGANLPGSIGSDARLDADRLEPFYARVEELGIPLFLHPTDAVFAEMLDGYNGALHLSLGRVVEVSVAAMRLVLSGLMERHPNLKIVVSHMGGALPYQSGRMDKNSKPAQLPQDPSVYLRRMYTDTVQPHTAGMKFGIEYYGIDHVMYGSDYPCWSPAAALKFFAEIGLSAEDQEKILNSNARRILNLREPVQQAVAAE